MKIFEVLDAPVETPIGTPADHVSKMDEERLTTTLYEFIIDDDLLHKDFFIPLAREINAEGDKVNREELPRRFMPMINKGCSLFYDAHGLKGLEEKILTKKMRAAVCQRIAEKSVEDILKGEYQLGDSQ